MTWNGAIAVSGSVTITITAKMNTGAAGHDHQQPGDHLLRRRTPNGTNDTSGVTDNPATPAAGDPTAVTGQGPIVPIPTLSELGLAALGLALTGAALLILRRRRTA